MEKQFDLTVIGGGPGGYVAAVRALQLGLKVAVVEEKDMGGTCLNWGCIPTKALLHSAELFYNAKHSSRSGIKFEGVSFDYVQIARNKDSIVSRLRSGVEFLVKSNGGTIITGKGVIKDRSTIEVSGKENITIKTNKIIIASGSRPLKPPMPGIDGDKVLDSSKVLALTECPERLVIMGGGVIGVEFATVFNSLGKEVTIIELMDTIIPVVDLEISMLLKKSLELKGVRIHTASRVTSILSGDKNTVCTFKQDGRLQKVEGDIIIVAIGRKPNSENMGLENVGIATDKGYIKIDDKMETSVKGIYSIGDVTGKVLLAHVASAQGLVAAANAAGKNEKMDYSIVPECIYTNPEIASVGFTEEEVKKRNINYRVGTFPISANGKSMIMGEREGMAKIITEADTGEILGAHIIGPRATDMISEICIAMKLEATIDEISETIHPHPTISEIIMEAAHDIEGVCVHKPKKSI